MGQFELEFAVILPQVWGVSRCEDRPISFNNLQRAAMSSAALCMRKQVSPDMAQRCDIQATQDERIMADGRPAYAWWNEIQMLRREHERLEPARLNLQDQFILLKIARWAVHEEPWSRCICIRLDRDEALLAEGKDALLNNPEKYCTIEHPQPRGEDGGK